MTASAPPRRWTRAELITLAVLVFGFGLWAMSMGQTSNWDLRNYHWYDGWAWLHGRQTQDLAVAQAQTWFNPVLPAALYLLLSSLKPWLGTFVLGCVQGLNIVPLHRLALQLLPETALRQWRWLALAVAFAGATGATQRGELGATFGDNLVSLPLLCALALLATAQVFDLRRQALAGALLGLAVGLKLTAAPLAAGIALVVPLLGNNWRERLRLTFCVGIAALAAFLLVHGHWMLELYREYGNPFFPLFADAFGGDFVPAGQQRDDRWIPHSLWQWLAYPLIWTDHNQLVSELRFLDLRVPALYLTLLALPLWWHRARADSPQPLALRFVLAAAIAGYLLWLSLFGYYRYAVMLEMLATLPLALALLALRGRAALVLLCAALLVLTLATRPARWGRAPHYGEQFIEVQLPPRPDYAQALIVLASGDPLGYLAPSFPPSTRFVRIRGNLMGPPHAEWALDREARRRLQAHGGPLYLIVVDLADPLLGETLQRQGLALTDGSCSPIRSNLYRREALPQLCELRRVLP